MSNEIRVLYIGDPVNGGEEFQQHVSKPGRSISMTYATSVEEGKNTFMVENFDCVVTHLETKETEWVSMLEFCRQRVSNISFILVSDIGIGDVGEVVVSKDVAGFIRKQASHEQFVSDLVAQIRSSVKERESNQRIARINQATNRLMDSDSPEEIAEVTVKTAKEIMQYELTGVHLYDEDEDGLVPVYVTEEFTELIGDPPIIRPGDSVSWEAYVTGEYQTYSDIREAGTVLNEETIVRSEIIFPLGEHGVLIIGSRNVNEFTNIDVSALTILATTAEKSLSRAKRMKTLRRFKKKIERQNVLFKEMEDIASIGGWEWNLHSHKGFTTYKLDNIFECEHDSNAHILMYINKYCDKDAQDRFKELYQNAIQNGEQFDLETQITTCENNTKWVRFRGVPEFENGKCMFIRGTAQDITVKKEYENEIKQFKFFVEHSPDMILILNNDGSVRYQSPASPLLDFTPKQITGENPLEYIHPDHRDRVMNEFNKLFESTTEIITSQYKALDADGNWRWFENRSINKVNESPINGIVTSIREISDQKETEGKLRSQNKRLERFTGIVGHDLRNPLNVATGNIELLANEMDNVQIRDTKEALHRMEELITNLLELAKKGEEIGDTEKINLYDLIVDAWTNVDTKQASVTMKIDSNARVTADETRLQQVLENLIRNSVEHGRSDVTITFGSLPDGFYVADDGDGISEEVKNDLFDVGVTSNESGTGFGLGIVQQVIEAHGWSITVDSGFEDGAKFDITGVCVDAEHNGSSTRQSSLVNYS